MLHITLPNNRKYSFETHRPSNMLIDFGTYGNGSIDWRPEGLHLYEIAEQLHIVQPLAGEIDGSLFPMNTFITQDCRVKFITSETAVGRKILKATGIFLLAYAAKQIMPHQLQRLRGAMLSTSTFCYDFIVNDNYNITDAEIADMQNYLDNLLTSTVFIKKKYEPYYQIRKQFQQLNEPYLIQRIDENDNGGPVAVYRINDFAEPMDDFLIGNLDMIQQIRIMQVENGLTRCRISAEIIV